MDKAAVTLQVYFEDPFWIGVVERVADGRLSAAKVTFGPEPRDYEVMGFFLKNYDRLRFSPAVETAVKEMHKNPKRIQREARSQTGTAGIGTKSQQALKLQQEEMKTERKVRSREQKEAEAERKFLLKQQKKKEKKRGR
ncbi:MAG: YjdF family protein [Lachnospiraceae bacterium]